jgi:hypothetical protein
MQGFRIEALKARLADCRVEAEALTPAEGEAIARVDLVAVTANNVTYAVHGGPPLHYWRFFPAGDSERCVVPLWGFGTIVESRHPDVAEGTRLYGYWPSASHVRLIPTRVRPTGFRDGAAHREGLAAVYNHYLPARQVATEEREPMVALYRPLFGTGFVLDEYLGHAPAAGTIILTSASSKTALATAWGLSRREGLDVVGLTSAGNRAFAQGTGCYSRVLAYEEADRLDPAAPAVLVDFSGNGALMARLHGHLGGLVASHRIGDTHWAEAAAETVPGPEPQWFFAPTVWQDMTGRLGEKGFETALAAATAAFLREAEEWTRVRALDGAPGFLAAFRAAVAGQADPAEGVVVRMAG